MFVPLANVDRRVTHFCIPNLQERAEVFEGKLDPLPQILHGIA
jgi:hypothetical protein